MKHLKALIEHVPVPLISVYSDDRISIWNNAARRLFGQHSVRELGDLAQFGAEFTSAVAQLRPGNRALAEKLFQQYTDAGLTQSLKVWEAMDINTLL